MPIIQVKQDAIKIKKYKVTLTFFAIVPYTVQLKSIYILYIYIIYKFFFPDFGGGASGPLSPTCRHPR